MILILACSLDICQVETGFGSAFLVWTSCARIYSSCFGFLFMCFFVFLSVLYRANGSCKKPTFLVLFDLFDDFTLAFLSFLIGAPYTGRHDSLRAGVFGLGTSTVTNLFSDAKGSSNSAL